MQELVLMVAITVTITAVMVEMDCTVVQDYEEKVDMKKLVGMKVEVAVVELVDGPLAVADVLTQ